MRVKISSHIRKKRSVRSAHTRKSTALLFGNKESAPTSLKEVDLPETVTNIGSRAFNGCISLKSVDIPASVTKIGICAFGGCILLESVKLPDGLIDLGDSAFLGCICLESISISSSLNILRWGVFGGCKGLKVVTILPGITNIERDAFRGCSNLVVVDILSRDVFDPFFRQADLREEGANIHPRAFSDCQRLSLVLVPDKLDAAASFFGSDPRVTVSSKSLRYWSPRCHNLLPKAIRTWVLTVFLAARRIRGFGHELPGLPVELWWMIVKQNKVKYMIWPSSASMCFT